MPSSSSATSSSSSALPWRARRRRNVEGTYTAIDNPDAFYQRVTSKGAKITRELEDTDYGSREFALVDPEGRGWSFGTWTHSPEPHIE